MKRLLWTIAICAIVSPSHATACMGSDSFEALIHSKIPRSLPKELVVARVKITSDKPDELSGPGLRARVEKLIQGNFQTKEIILRSRIWSSCDYPFDNGKSGLIVGVARESEGGAQVIEPILVDRGEKHTLPEGYALPPYFTDPDFLRRITRDVDDSLARIYGEHPERLFDPSRKTDSVAP